MPAFLVLHVKVNRTQFSISMCREFAHKSIRRIIYSFEWERRRVGAQKSRLNLMNTTAKLNHRSGSLSSVFCLCLSVEFCSLTILHFPIQLKSKQNYNCLACKNLEHFCLAAVCCALFTRDNAEQHNKRGFIFLFIFHTCLSNANGRKM